MTTPENPPLLSVTLGTHGNVVVAHVRGEMDYHSAPLVRQGLSQAWALPDVATVIVDLSAVSFCDSMGLSELIAALRRSQDTGVPLRITAVQPQVARLLRLTGLWRVFDIRSSLAEALPSELTDQPEEAGDRRPPDCDQSTALTSS
ncbi:STAS domain-containing protein [Sphaerisporangium fuscum]|uniref:STAS domain-containing protein n=1 Tax=Sphaerisporangium fuscum TaxID=2835868 RepID=UPI001BDCEFCC|nr:STAS domain-containing protein [Sphaerisporangium fuscum]